MCARACDELIRQYTGTVPADLGQISIDIIHPATEKHISKHEEQQYFMVSFSLLTGPNFPSSPLHEGF